MFDALRSRLLRLLCCAGARRAMAPDPGGGGDAPAPAAVATPSFHQLLAWSDASFLVLRRADAVPLYVSPSAAHVFGAEPAALLGCALQRRSFLSQRAPVRGFPPRRPPRHAPPR